jgi:hypothetical protein
MSFAEWIEQMTLAEYAVFMIVVCIIGFWIGYFIGWLRG